MNLDQRQRIEHANQTVANVIDELRAGLGEIIGGDLRYLEQGHFQLTKALEQKQK